MSDVIYQPSDLASKRVEFLDTARTGLARLRDKDGTSLVMLPESRLHLLETIFEWSNAKARIERLLSRNERPTISDLGDLAWLRSFDEDDLREFIEELNDCLLAAHSDGSTDVLDAAISAWRTTARQLEDPLRRAVLMGRVAPQELAEAPRPSGDE